jgi:hypothetical protein
MSTHSQYRLSERVEKFGIVLSWLGVCSFALYLGLRAVDHHNFQIIFLQKILVNHKYKILVFATSMLLFSEIVNLVLRNLFMLTADHSRISQHYAAVYRVSPIQADALPAHYFDGTFSRTDIRAAAHVHQSAYFYSKLMQLDKNSRAGLLVFIILILILAIYLREVNLYELITILLASEVGLVRFIQPYAIYKQMSRLQSEVLQLVGHMLAGTYEVKSTHAEILALYGRYFDLKARSGARVPIARYEKLNDELTSRWCRDHLPFFSAADLQLQPSLSK